MNRSALVETTPFAIQMHGCIDSSPQVVDQEDVNMLFEIVKPSF